MFMQPVSIFFAQRDSQVNSTDLSAVEIQGCLPLRRRAAVNSMPLEVIRKKPTSGAAFTLACDSSGLEDQEIADQCGIDAGSFSKMKRGKATLQGDLLKTFCQVVGNNIYAEWLAYQLGCTLVEIKSEAEKRAEALQAALDEERKLRMYAENLLARRAA